MIRYCFLVPTQCADYNTVPTQCADNSSILYQPITQTTVQYCTHPVRRLQFNAVPTQYAPDYNTVATYAEVVDALWRHSGGRLRVILDAHQDLLSPKFCGEGVPDWAAGSLRGYKLSSHRRTKKVRHVLVSALNIIMQICKVYRTRTRKPVFKTRHGVLYTYYFV